MAHIRINWMYILLVVLQKDWICSLLFHTHMKQKQIYLLMFSIWIYSCVRNIYDINEKKNPEREKIPMLF